MKIYLARHQKAGILTQFAFTGYPNASQLEPIAAKCEEAHGPGGWMKVYEMELLPEGGIPSFGGPGPGVRPFAVTGKGEVG